jgi:adenosylhomocysteine nucleosidase
MRASACRALFPLLLSLLSVRATAAEPSVVVLVSADGEWAGLRPRLATSALRRSPFGEWLVTRPPGARDVVLFHGGWGKVSAAASTQYVIDRFHPRLLVNLGTCGGLEGAAREGEVLLVERTSIYDIVEQMGDAQEALAAYATSIDTAWAGRELPKGVRRAALLSADRDVLVGDVPGLRARGAVAADWESGAIAWVAHRNGVPILILRYVSDVVGARGDATYGNEQAFRDAARRAMETLMDGLPWWLARATADGPLRPARP